jgi:serine/threonine-protein kinase
LIGRLVAIKVIVADYVDNPELLKRFYREAKAVGNLQHPNIVIVYDLGEENHNPYLVMEYLDGEPLNKIIASRRELSLLQKLGIVAKVCDALSYAHQRDIVHRDVKPANVLLLKNGQVKLLDFGIARLGKSGYTQTETRKGQVMGTMSYIAPEQLNEEIVDGRSDVYSTGVMLFELLTYRLPFEATDLGSLIVKKMQAGPPPSLSKYLENYPPELDDIVGRALARDRDERYNTAQDFAFDLERLIERLKRDMVSHYVDRARACISSAELGKAKDILSEVLKIDTQHTAAKQLLYEVQQSLQKQQRGEYIRQLRQHAEEAITLKEFDDASKFAEEAIRLDKTDPDLLNLRERIQQAKQRAQQVKKLLHLAEVAQQSGELRVFERAVADAVALDPEDPQVRVLQASLIRLQAEQEKESRVQELLVAARREIAARQFDAAQEYIRKAETLDPHRNDVPGLKAMVAAGHEQETRKRQLQQLCGSIQQELEANNLRVARDLAEKALRAFPGEPTLLRMKSAAESQIEAEERRKYIEDRIASASKLLERDEPSRALSLIQEASRQFPTDTRLRDFLQMLRQAVQQEAVKREQLDLLAQARAAMQQKRFADAVEILEPGQIKYPDLRDVGDLLSLARKEQDLLAQKSKVADVSRQAQTLVAHRAFGDALSLLEKTVVDISDPILKEFLESVRAQAAEFDANLDALKKEATVLLEAGRSAEALLVLESHASTYGHCAGFSDFLQRVQEQVSEEQESKQQLARVLDEARLYLQRGALRQAEAALAECSARAPRDAGVVAFLSQLNEAKAMIEREREIQPPRAPEVPPYPEPKANAAAATVMFNPAAAVADSTPAAGTPVAPEEVGPGISRTVISRVPADSAGSSSATVLFEGIAAEPAAAPDLALVEIQQLRRALEDSPTPTMRLETGARALAIQAAHPDEASIQRTCAEIAEILQRWGERRESAVAELTRIAEQITRVPIGELESLRDRADRVGEAFATEAEVAGLLQQIRHETDYQAKTLQRVLQELEDLRKDVSKSRSLAELSTVLGRGNALSSSHASVSAALMELQVAVEARRSSIQSAISKAEKIGEQVAHAATVDDAERALAQTKEFAGTHADNADVQEIVKRFSIQVQERQLEHDHTVHELNSLSASIPLTQSAADLASIENRAAQCRVKHPREKKIAALCDQLETDIRLRRLEFGSDHGQDVLNAGTRVAARDAATQRFTVPIEVSSPPPIPTRDFGAAAELEPRGSEVALVLPPPGVSRGAKLSSRRLLVLAGLILLSAIAAGVYWRMTHTPTNEVVSLAVQTSPSGATVHSGGESCTAPCILKLKPGKYEITADLTGYVSAQRPIDLQKNQSESLSLTPTQPAASAETPSTEKPTESTPEAPGASPQVVGKGTLMVRSGIEGATVMIDDHPAGVTTKAGFYRGPVDVGQHSVRVQKEGYPNPKPQTVVIAKNRPTTLSFDLKPNIAPPAMVSSPPPTPNPPIPAPATLVLRVPTGASVRIDQQPPSEATSSAPLTFPLVAGDHSIEVTMEGHKPWSSRQTLVAGSRLELTAELPKLTTPPAAAPETATASSPPPTPVESAPKVDEDRRIRDLLDAYVGAIRDRDPDQLRHVYPHISDKDLSSWKTTFSVAESIQVSLEDCKQGPVLNGAANVTCRQTYEIRSQGSTKTMSKTADFTLRKLKPGDWIIDKAVFR